MNELFHSRCLEVHAAISPYPLMKVVETVETILLRIDNHNAYTNLDSKSIIITDDMVKSI